MIIKTGIRISDKKQEIYVVVIPDYRTLTDT